MTDEQIKTLLEINQPSDIKSFAISSIYEDDHQQCTDVIINGVPVEFLWYDNVGFVEYWEESPKAFDKLQSAIMSFVRMKLDESEFDEVCSEQHSEWRDKVEDFFMR